MMIKRLLLFLPAFLPIIGLAQSGNYLGYHREVIEAEKHIVSRNFSESLGTYRKLADEYPYIFLRDCKIAAQLAAYTNDTENLFYFLERGMKKGWTLRKIKKNEHLKKFKTDTRWRTLKGNQDKYKKEFHQSINSALRSEIKEMFRQDQKRALRVALTPIKKWRDRYTNRKFVPNNRAQVRRISEVIDQTGYPGEKIIGDKSWVTVIISHNEHDTIYNTLRPKLYAAFEKGELAAIDLAIIETWRVIVDTNREDKGFIIWNDEVTVNEAAHADSLRNTIALRNIELNNALIRAEKELKMNFFLSPFHGGLITVKE